MQIGEVSDQLQPLPRWAKKDCELWSTNKKVIDLHVDPPKLNFSITFTEVIAKLKPGFRFFGPPLFWTTLYIN